MKQQPKPHESRGVNFKLVYDLSNNYPWINVSALPFCHHGQFGQYDEYSLRMLLEDRS